MVAPIPGFPFAGTWIGQMQLRLDTLPVAVDIAITNGKYTGVSYGPGGGRMNHKSTDLVGKALRWEIKNSGAGIWVYEATKISGDTLYGTVTLRDGPGRDGNPEGGKLILIRQRR